MIYVTFLLIGVIIGVAVTCYVFKKTSKPSGSFIIDVSDPMKDICNLQLDETLDSIFSKKKIILRVKTFTENSPK